MILLRSLNLVDIPEKELEKNFETLVSGAEQMLRARVTITPADWIMLCEAERLAFAEAGDRLQAELAYMIGTAVLNPKMQEHLIEEAHGPEGSKKLREVGALERLRELMEGRATVDAALEGGA